jgi:hypothetical protein
MTIATLLHPDDPSFAFDHDQLHRAMFAVTPPGQFSATPYLLDPIQDQTVPAGWWDVNHAQAHEDFAAAFPAITWPSTVEVAAINLETGPTLWWALSNWHLHTIANAMLKPNP